MAILCRLEYWIILTLLLHVNWLICFHHERSVSSSSSFPDETWRLRRVKQLAKASGAELITLGVSQLVKAELILEIISDHAYEETRLAQRSPRTLPTQGLKPCRTQGKDTDFRDFFFLVEVRGLT